MSYSLTGDFVECCDCFTVCPCWVNDVPDEDHCNGLYLWSFDAGSRIGDVDVDVAGTHVAAAAFHAVRSRGQAIFFIDAKGSAAAHTALVDAFSGGLQGRGFDALRALLGDILDYRAARITSTFTRGEFHVDVAIGSHLIAHAQGADRIFEGQGTAMTLRDAALSDELGIGSGAVTVQAMGDLTVDVAALPGGPLYLRGRSGMRGRFAYAPAGRPRRRGAPATARDATAED